jgi:hypothetical protein
MGLAEVGRSLPIRPVLVRSERGEVETGVGQDRCGYSAAGLGKAVKEVMAFDAV